MDFELTDEQRLIQSTVRSFVDERVLPNAIENDINHHLDLGVIEGMAELGLLGIVIPEEYGGAGLDFVAEALSCEEIERGEAAFRTLISVHVGLNSLALLRYGSEEQKQRYLVPQAKGEKLACFGLTEPGAGSEGAGLRGRDVRARPGAVHGRRRGLRGDPRLSRALGLIRARAGDVRAADRPLPARPGDDREDGARLRDVQTPRHAGGVDEERGAA